MTATTSSPLVPMAGEKPVEARIRAPVFGDTPRLDRSTLTSGDVAVARTVAEVEQLRPFWNAQPTSRDGDLDFYLAIVQRRDEVVRPHVITISESGQPRSMLIGRLEITRLPIRFGYFHLPVPLLRVLTFIGGGMLDNVSASDGELMMRSILRSLRAGEADVALLTHLDISHSLSELARTLPSLLCADRFLDAQAHYRRRLDRDGSPLASLSANERNNQRRREKRLRQDFRDVRIECFHDGSSLETLLRDAEAVASTSYQRGLGVGFASTIEMRERLAFEADKGTLRGHILYADGRPCAFWIASLYRGVLANDFMAFDPAFSKYAPGVYLVLNVLEEVRRDPLAGADPAVDFGIGDAEWKMRLANEQWQEASIAVFAPSVRGIAVNLARTISMAADRGTRSLLQRSRLLPRIKRLWRRRLSR